MLTITSQFTPLKSPNIADPVAAIVRTIADMQRLKGQREAGATTEGGTATMAGDQTRLVAGKSTEALDQVTLSAAATGRTVQPMAIEEGNYGYRLRAGTDGMSEMIAFREESVALSKTMVASMRDTVKLYEETGKVYSKYGNWTPSEEDLSFHGGAEAFVQSWRDQIEVITNIGVPQEQASIDTLRADRLQSLRDYGLAPPSVDQVA